MDRNRANQNLRTAVILACVAMFFFGLAFYASILYVA